MKKGLFLYLFSLMAVLPVLAQMRTLTGTVKADSSGTPLSGVTIHIKGAASRVVSAPDGSFSISVGGTPELQFSMVGYESRQVKVGSDVSWLDVKLRAVTSGLSEVVVVGYGEQPQRYTTEAVSVMNAGSITNVPAVSPQQLLQGQLAGVNMTNSSGMLGNASLVRVRGTASITAGSQPLFVVDGVPLNDGTYSTSYGGGSALNPLLEINPEDIASITVLKDAAAAAIYGSRGSNGVMLIETKKGAHNRKTQLKLDYYTGWVSPTDKLHVMNGDEYRTFYNDYITKVKGSNPVNFPATSTDWPSLLTRTGRTSNYALSASGGNGNTRFYVGGNYLDGENYIVGNNLQRLSGRLNLEHTANQYLQFGVNFSTAYTDMDRVYQEGNAINDNSLPPYTAAFLNTPFNPAYTDDGQFASPGTNALANILLSTNKYYTRRNTGNAYAKLNITKELWVKSDWGIDLLETEERTRRSAKLTGTVNPGSASRTIYQDNKWLSTNSLNFDKQIAGMHQVTLLAAHSYETARYDDIRASGNGFTGDQFPNVGSAAVTTGSATGKRWALESYIFRGNYRFADKYLFEGTFRRDGSSRFGSNKKYGNFWAVSGGWILSQEQFMKDVRFIDYMKLTASYGVTGNDRINYYDYLGLYSSSDASYAGQPGLRPTQIKNPDLSWEETGQFDLGLSVNALDNRIQLTVDYYNKNSKNLLLYLAVPSTTGFGFSTRNAGKMRNRGVDVQITGIPVRKRDLQWTTSLNLGFVKNKILALSSDNRDEAGRNFVLSSYGGQRVIEGYALNSFYLHRYKGINPETGDPEWYTKDGKATTAPTNNDQIIAGNAMPKLTGGFNNTVRYKQFDLGVNFYFSYGNKVMLNEFQLLDNATLNTNLSKDMLNYWQKPGDQAFAPAATSASWHTKPFSQLSTAQLFDGSFL